MTETHTTRLNKFLALHTGTSRREADNAIIAGRVSVDGQRAQLGQHITATQSVELDGKSVVQITNHTYIALHKPRGYVCSRKRQGENPTIYELIPEQYHTLKPVGRLDRDSSGIILLTNDGDFAHRMTHPSFRKQKQYEVSVDHELQPLHRQMISEFGVMLEDGKSQFLISRQNEDDSSNNTDWIIRMGEGRNRQIRRTFAALGYAVTRLHRTQFGAYSLGDITEGSHKILDISQIA